MSKFNMRIKYEDKVLVKVKGDKLDDFDNLIKGLKKKFGGSK